jgi:TonB-dependent receptor
MGNWGGVDPDTFGSNWPNYFTSVDFADGFDQGSATGNVNFLHQGVRANFGNVVDALEHTYALAQNAIKVMGDDPTTVDDPSTTDAVENLEEFYWVSALPAPGQDPWENRIRDLTPDNFNNFPDGKVKLNGIINVNRVIDEEINSFYIAYSGGFMVGDMEANLGLGVRYEETTVTSTSIVTNVADLSWDGDNDWSQIADQNNRITLTSESSYDNVLPNIDFDLSVTDDVKVRASYSTTMARPAYADLKTEITISDIYQKQTSAGNPDLIAMESDNIDLSVEWYYDDASYVSAAYFTKDVSNFIGSGSILAPAYGLTDLRNSPAYNAAIAGGLNPSQEQALHDAVCGSAAPCTSADYLAANPGQTLPELLWTQSRPTNNRDAKIDGLELSVQHWFGDSGFGVQANYTMVDSDLEYDDTSTAEQFALIGLSDTANLVGMYENYGFQARIAYNWRDEFLSNTNQGGNNSPGYTEEYSQIDVSLGYEVNEYVSLTLEGLNVTGEDYRVRGRSAYQLYNFEDLGARYAAGVRVTF